MFSQMAHNKNGSHLECKAFVDIGGKYICSPDEIESLIDEVQISSIYHQENFDFSL